MAKESLTGRISRMASDLPATMITIGSGLAGLLMPSPSGSAASNMLNGEIEGTFDAIAYNYAGVNTRSNKNGLGDILKRAKGTWAAVGGQILKSVYRAF